MDVTLKTMMRNDHGPIEFATDAELSRTKAGKAATDKLASSLRTDERTKKVQQVNRWITRNKQEYINDSRRFQIVEEENHRIAPAFLAAEESLKTTLDECEERSEATLRRFQDGMKRGRQRIEGKIGAKKGAAGGEGGEGDGEGGGEGGGGDAGGVGGVGGAGSKGEDGGEIVSRRMALEMKVAGLQTELMEVEDKLAEHSSGQLDQINALSATYESRTKHLLDVISSQQDKITAVAAEVSSNEDHLRKLRMDREEMNLYAEISNANPLLQKRVEEIVQRKETARVRAQSAAEAAEGAEGGAGGRKGLSSLEKEKLARFRKDNQALRAEQMELRAEVARLSEATFEASKPRELLAEKSREVRKTEEDTKKLNGTLSQLQGEMTTLNASLSSPEYSIVDITAKQQLLDTLRGKRRELEGLLRGMETFGGGEAAGTAVS